MTEVKAARDDDARIQVYEETPRYIIEFALVAGFLTFLVTMAALRMSVSTIASVAVIFGAATFRILPCLNRMNTYTAILMGAVPTFDNLYPELVVPERPRGSATLVLPIGFEDAIHVDGV